jgi:hypothetical protein
MSTPANGKVAQTTKKGKFYVLNDKSDAESA